MYYLYSCISGSLEIGIIYGGILKGYPLWQVLILGLAYQIGNLVPLPCVLAKKERCLGIVVILVLWCISAGTPDEMIKWLCLIGTITILSGLIQSMRAAFSFSGEKWKKRFFRVIGFGTAFFYGMNLEICIAMVATFMMITELYRKSEIKSAKSNVLSGIQLNRTMIFHQMHYFVYAYSMIELAHSMLKHSALALLFFVISWFTYLMTEPMLRRFGHGKWLRYLMVGHLLLALSLFLASYAAVKESNWFFLIWILSGFGGGTVFCVKLVEQEKGRGISADNWVLSENLGHILGCFAACFWVATGMKTALLPAVGACFAILTVLSAVVKERLAGRYRDEHI